MGVIITGGSSTDDLELISTITISGVDTNTATFTGLTGDNTYLIIASILNNSITANYSIYINADTTATNYYTQSFVADDAAIAGAVSNASYVGNILQVDSSLIQIIITNPINKKVKMSSICSGCEAGDIKTITYSVVKTTDTTEINTINLLASQAAGLAVGSKISLYKIKS